MRFEEFAELVASRRTSMLVEPDRAVPTALVEQLCRVAQMAPSHKRTWPWRFALATGNGRTRLGAAVAGAMEAYGDEPAKVAKARTKYLRTPAVLVVGAVAGDTELRTAENRDAAAAGVQNALLGATAAGLASYWSSCPRGADDAVGALCGFPPAAKIVALIYLGWPSGVPDAPSRPPVELILLT